MPRFYAGQRFGQIAGLVLGTVYLAVMLVAILEGYPLVGVGGALLAGAAFIWAIRRDPSSPGALPGGTQETPGALPSSEAQAADDTSDSSR